MKQFFNTHKIYFLTWFTGLMLLYQVLNLHSYVADVIDHRAIVAANDDDAAWNVAKTVQTRWYKDNGWVLYGPFYFRLNHTLQYFWGRTADPDFISRHENWERTAHHAILTTSLLAVTGISLLIAGGLLPLWWMRFLFAIGMNAALLANATWSELLLRAHPDHLFSLAAVGALFMTWRMFGEDGVWRKLSAYAWGISVSVKMTLSLCAPGFFLLFLPPFRRERWKSGLRYLGMMLLAYFIIGFPQTIVLGRPFRDLKTINGLSAAPTWQSVQHWIEVFGLQLWGPILIVLLAVVCFQRRRWQMPRDGWLRLSIFAVLPFLILLGKNMLVPADHYAMPFVAMLTLMLGFWSTRLPDFLGERWLAARAMIFLAATLAIWGSTPAALQTALERRLHCRPEARETYAKVLDLYKRGEKIWVDPYVPYLTAADPSRMELSWEKTLSGYDRGHWTVLALYKEFRERFTSGAEADAYTQVDIPAWRSVREFYLPFAQGETATLPNGDVFNREYANSCGQEIWVKGAARH